jgi:hypothetical protein
MRGLQDRLAEAEQGRETSRAERNRAKAFGQATARDAERARTAVTHLQARLRSLSQ